MRSVFLAFTLAAASCAANPTNNSPGSGGSSSGGAPGTGGKTTSTGGKTTGAGGAVGTGGAIGTGGSSQPPASTDCADTSAYSNTINTQYGGASITTGTSKTYYMQANWWDSYTGNETEQISGLGFTIGNPTGAVTPKTTNDPNGNNPMGFPSIFIGSYAGHTTTGSNLPKQVSALTSVPTIFSTNADQKGVSNYNATYDVWFTANGTPLSSGQSSPGAGGAYLMVWLFQPSDRQPRGKVVANGSVIKGVTGGWDVWYDATNPPCVSYVSSNKLASLQFDLNNFIQDAVTSGYGVTSSQYLSIIFAGFEVWGGADGLQEKAFCANVK
jgi:hypothetical protein